MLMTVLVALCLSGAAVGWHFFLRSPTPTLSRYAPKDAELFVEIVDVRRLALSVAASDAVVDDELDASRQLDRLAGALANGFDLREAEADTIVESVASVAVVGRSLERVGAPSQLGLERRPEAALLVRFSTSAPLEAIKDSPRFDEAERFFGAEELRLRPAKKPLDGDVRHWGDALARVFESIESSRDADVPKKDRRAPFFAVVLIAAENLLVIGTRDLALDVARVAGGDKSSLDDNERFRDLTWERGATVVAFFEPTVDVATRENFLRDVPALKGAAWFSGDGLMSTSSATLRGYAIHEEPFIPKASSFSVVSLLPERTFAYAALSLDGRGSPKERARDLMATVDALHPIAALEFHRALLAYERELGGTLPALLEAVGGELVLGVAADEVPAPSRLESKETFFEHATLVGIMEVGDVDLADTALSDFRTILERQMASTHTMEGVPGGFLMRPRAASSGGRPPSAREEPTLRVTIEARKHLLLVMGGAAEVEDYADSFSDGDSIGKNEAHTNARAALPSSLTALAWADAGALLAAELTHDKTTRRALAEAAVPVDALRLEGRRRVSSAVGLVLKSSGGEVHIEATMLNAPLLLALGGFLGDAKEATPRSQAESKNADAAVGIPECDEYLKAIADCAKDAPEPVRDALLQSAKSFRESFRNMPDPLVMRGVCSQARTALKESGGCD